MQIIALSLVYLAIIAAEVPYLLKSKLWKELAAFSILLLLALFYSIGLVLDKPLPNLIDLLEILFVPVTKFLEQL